MIMAWYNNINWRRGIPAAILLGAGLVLVGQGLWIPVKAAVAQVLLQRAFTESLRTGTAVKPWSWADTWPVARVAVPRLHRSIIVLHGSSGQALAFGPGHLERTAEPGEPGTAVFSAHRDTHFDFLGDVGIGDDIVVTRRDGTDRTFRVTHTTVERWDSAQIDLSGRRLVLSTCWPLNAKVPGPLRYLVHAEMLEPPGPRCHECGSGGKPVSG